MLIVSLTRSSHSHPETYILVAQQHTHRFSQIKPVPNRLRRCIATINRWTDYCNNREIIVVIILDVSKTLQNNRSRWFKKIITLMVMLTP